MALFVLSTKDGWVQIMYTGLDAVGEDMQPQENYNEFLLVYFISFLLLVGFFVLNMFVGVVVENFHKCRASQEKEEKARRAAKRARRMEKKRKRIREIPYWAGYSRWRHTIHSFVDSKYFDLVIATIIGLNVITMAMEFYLMPKELDYALKTANYIFTSVFIIEAVCKVVALGAKRYFKDRWNQLDVLIVVLSVSGIVLEEMEAKIIPINPTIIRVMRVLRIARVLKLLKMAKGIRALLDTVIQALPQVGNLGLLFFLLFFIFAALGVELFGRLECSLDNPCVGLNRHAHFENFGMAFLTLFRIATGDNWNGIMKDTLRKKCDASDQCVKNCCVSHVIAPIYFVVFVLMAQFVLVNVVVAVLMKHLEESHKMMSDDDELEKEIRRELEEENRENQRQRDRRERERKEQLTRKSATAGNKTTLAVAKTVVVDVNASASDFVVEDGSTARTGAAAASAATAEVTDEDIANGNDEEEDLLLQEAELEAVAACRKASLPASEAAAVSLTGASVAAVQTLGMTERLVIWPMVTSQIIEHSGLVFEPLRGPRAATHQPVLVGVAPGSLMLPLLPRLAASRSSVMSLPNPVGGGLGGLSTAADIDRSHGCQVLIFAATLSAASVVALVASAVAGGAARDAASLTGEIVLAVEPDHFSPVVNLDGVAKGYLRSHRPARGGGGRGGGEPPSTLLTVFRGLAVPSQLELSSHSLLIGAAPHSQIPQAGCQLGLENCSAAGHRPASSAQVQRQALDLVGANFSTPSKPPSTPAQSGGSLSVVVKADVVVVAGVVVFDVVSQLINRALEVSEVTLDCSGLSAVHGESVFQPLLLRWLTGGSC
uniref:Voltage-dependent T-type calcium channel subunit alpha-1G n=1 Tax=Macrostomum lignano TaxID=282301 RepID=A0A1I8GAZ5_9PLAT